MSCRLRSKLFNHDFSDTVHRVTIQYILQHGNDRFAVVNDGDEAKVLRFSVWASRGPSNDDLASYSWASLFPLVYPQHTWSIIIVITLSVVINSMRLNYYFLTVIMIAIIDDWRVCCLLHFRVYIHHSLTAQFWPYRWRGRRQMV